VGGIVKRSDPPESAEGLAMVDPWRGHPGLALFVFDAPSRLKNKGKMPSPQRTIAKAFGLDDATRRSRRPALSKGLFSGLCDRPGGRVRPPIRRRNPASQAVAIRHPGTPPSRPRRDIWAQIREKPLKK
jgi:hypothetical protein